MYNQDDVDYQEFLHEKEMDKAIDEYQMDNARKAEEERQMARSDSHVYSKPMTQLEEYEAKERSRSWFDRNKVVLIAIGILLAWALLGEILGERYGPGPEQKQEYVPYH